MHSFFTIGQTAPQFYQKQTAKLHCSTTILYEISSHLTLKGPIALSVMKYFIVRYRYQLLTTVSSK